MGNEKKRESIHFNKYLDVKVLWIIKNLVEFSFEILCKYLIRGAQASIQYSVVEFCLLCNSIYLAVVRKKNCETMDIQRK